MAGERMKKVLLGIRVSMFPPEHGGAKNFRHILKALTQEGVECRVVVRLKPAAGGPPRFAGQKAADLPAEHEGVRYMGTPGAEMARKLAQEIETFMPDAVILSDDPVDDGDELFAAGAASGRLVYFGQTVHFLPFGPYSVMPSAAVTASLTQAAKVVVPSAHVKAYVEEHLGKTPVIFHPPVFGEGPFPVLGHQDNDFVTMINPCPWKGSSIFLKIARARPNVAFAAVPTWGATPELLDELRALPNMTLLPQTQDVDEIYARTRVLLAPSLCQEAFGLVSPEALLRGIPVVASDIAGLKESTLAAATLIPVIPLPFSRPREDHDHGKFKWEEPDNDVGPWLAALDALLTRPRLYEETARVGKNRAEKFVRALSKTSARNLIWI
jgi:glycosyltransferase involved in cell wall biosynthesis